MPGGTRQDTYSVTVTLNGVNEGVWDKKDGGEVDSEEFKYNPGGMVPPVSLGGRKNVGNVTLSRLFRLDRDQANLQRYINNVGRGSIVIAQQPLDIDGNAYGAPLIYRGTLKRCTPPTVDSESSSPGMIELEVTIEGYPTV
jgi:hypothetical protein